MDVRKAIDYLKTELRNLDRVIDAIESIIERSVVAKQERRTPKLKKRKTTRRPHA